MNYVELIQLQAEQVFADSSGQLIVRKVCGYCCLEQGKCIGAFDVRGHEFHHAGLVDSREELCDV